MLDHLSKTWELVYSEGTDYEMEVRNSLSAAFCILNHLQNNNNRAEFAKGYNYLPEKRVQAFLDYIHLRYRDKITIVDLAKAASISKTEVLRCFQTIMGTSPIRYLNSYRLQTAAQMLLNTDSSIQEISECCSFEDNSYFAKQFKKKYHVTPHDYRSEMR